MSFADGAQAEDEAKATRRSASLIRMRDDARIEECRSLERILVQEIRADQLALHLGEDIVDDEGILHLVGTRLERRQQIAVTPLEVLQDIGQQMHRHGGIER